MPLKLNVGASRKVTDNNYGSRGASVNLKIELDTTLVTDPPKLQEKIRHLFQVVRTSLAEELNGGDHHANGRNSPTGNGEHAAADHPPVNGNGAYRGSGNAGPRRSTPSQCKAIYAIARANGIHLGDYLHQRYQTARPNELTLRQASEAIDDLRAFGVGAGAAETGPRSDRRPA
jgi:hypothetical protein